MTERSLIATATVASSAPPEVRARPADASPLTRSACDLRDAARAFRDTADAQHDADDLARAFRLVEETLEDLAAGAELVAYATMEASRRRRAGAAAGLPLATARARSWRLHGLRSGLVAAQRICAELTRVLDGPERH